MLTSLNVVTDAGGNFYDPATRGFSFAPFLGLPVGPDVGVTTETGAQINALQPNSYVAMVGQRIAHGGSVRVDGSAAYAAGRAIQLRANQGLFDIIIETGTANAAPLTHIGTTGGPASLASDDFRASTWRR